MICRRPQTIRPALMKQLMKMSVRSLRQYLLREQISSLPGRSLRSLEDGNEMGAATKRIWLWSPISLLKMNRFYRKKVAWSPEATVTITRGGLQRQVMVDLANGMIMDFSILYRTVPRTPVPGLVHMVLVLKSYWQHSMAALYSGKSFLSPLNS